MTLSALLNRSVTITRRLATGTEDDFGNLVPDEETVETTGELQQRDREEPGSMGEVSDTEWLLILRPGTALHSGDVISCDGEDYEVTGEPWQVRNPRTQALSHVEATVRRTAGADDEVGS